MTRCPRKGFPAGVASDDLPGGADPGWNALWGAGFLEFLPRVPGALWEVARLPWTSVQILRRPSAALPSLQDDPAWFLLGMVILWGGDLLWMIHRLGGPIDPARPAERSRD